MSEAKRKRDAVYGAIWRGITMWFDRIGKTSTGKNGEMIMGCVSEVFTTSPNTEGDPSGTWPRSGLTQNDEDSAPRLWWA